MKRKLFSLSCCLVLMLTGLFTSCQQEAPEPEMVTVSYVSEFGTLTKTEKIVEKGYKLTAENLPALTENGYTFDKWYINKEEAKVGTVINKDTVLVAKWNKGLDETAPMDVTFGEIAAADGKAVISWTIPTDMDSDLKGFELSMKPACGTLENPVILGTTVKSFSVDGLTNGTNYTFTIKSFDTRMNFSTGVSKDATPSDTSDKTAPTEVTNPSATNLDGTVALSWTDPTDTDLFGIEVTYTPKSTILTRSIEKMVEESIFVSPNTQYVEIPKLSNETEYTFTLKTMDLSGNKSDGVTVKCTPKIIEGNPLSITLTPSTSEKTNKDITVSVKVNNTRKVKTVKYAEGTHDVSYFATTGTDVKDNSFTVTKNGTYTVYVLDVDGKREVKTIDVTNIDKTAPGVLKNFFATYNAANKKITLAWNEPADTDYANVTITTDGANPKVFNKGTTTYEIPKIEPNDTKTYTFKAVTKDDIGNEGTESTVTIIAKNQPIINSIELSRNHLAYNDADQTIDVTIKGSNFDLIKTQPDKTVLVGIFEGSAKKGDYFTATVTESSNSATVTVTVPKLTSSSETGTTYTVKAKICGTFADVAKDFIVSNPASISRASLSINQISSSKVTDTSKVTFTGSGYNLDLLKNLKVGLYDNTDKLVGNAVTVNTSGYTNTITEFTAEIPLKKGVEGVLTAKVLFDDVIATYDSCPTLQIFGVPKFTSFSIPKASTTKQDNLLVATVTGTNFKAPGIDASSFSVSCDSNANITNGAKIEVINDTTLKVTLTIPNLANDYKVTIGNGSNFCEGTFIVKDYSKGYEAGKLLLSDGSVVDYASYSSTSDKTPIAVLCGFNSYGAPLLLGLKQSETRLAWAESDSTGCSTKFTDIICTPSATGSGAADNKDLTFTGDIDGSDNWSVICGKDTAGTATEVVATNYPAFNWVNTYGEKNVSSENYKTGWYMPSIAELTEIYRNKAEVNAALNKLGTGIASPLKDSYYWSSSQYGPYYVSAWELYFSNGYLDYYDKNSGSAVCCVRAF